MSNNSIGTLLGVLVANSILIACLVLIVIKISNIMN